MQWYWELNDYKTLQVVSPKHDSTVMLSDFEKLLIGINKFKRASLNPVMVCFLLVIPSVCVLIENSNFRVIKKFQTIIIIIFNNNIIIMFYSKQCKMKITVNN